MADPITDLNEQDLIVLKRLASASVRLLEDEGFLEMLKTLKNDAIKKWADGKSTNERESAWHELQAVGRLENRVRDFPNKWELQKRKLDTMRPKRQGGG